MTSSTEWQQIQELRAELHKANDGLIAYAKEIVQLKAERDAAYVRGLERAKDEIPSNWLDSLLTGPDAIVGKKLTEVQLTERLFNAVRARIIVLISRENKFV